ncbi:hypothetical protein [Thioclava pacifica]|uniref:hypothetical protein n=1 Tax=Thioclava pacifica TaxID=285109 RepID=UPI0012F7167E|nr:hypothetical protein [Thioclava pacifica]
MSEESVERFRVYTESRSISDLVAALEKEDGQHSPREVKENKDLKERWVLRKWLSSVGFAQQLVGPFDLLQSERPDFTLAHAGGTLGIEVAEITSQVVANYRKVVSENEEVFFSLPKPGDFPDNARAEKLRDHLLSPDKTRPYSGTEPENEIVQLTIKTIEKKRRKSQSYASADMLVLLLYENSGRPRDLWDEAHAPDAIAEAVMRACGEFSYVALWPVAEFSTEDGSFVEYLNR